MNMQEPEDWVRMRNELCVILSRVVQDYKIHIGVNPADAAERKNYHHVGGSAVTHIAKINSMIKLMEAYAKIPSNAAVDEILKGVRTAISAEDSLQEEKEEGDSGDDRTCGAV